MRTKNNKIKNSLLNPNLFILCFILFFSCSAMAQEQQDSIVKKESRWSMGFYYSPNYSFYNYVRDERAVWQAFPHGQTLYKPDKFYFNNYPQNGETKNQGKLNLLPFSVMFRFQTTKKFIIYTGLDFLHLGYLGEGESVFNCNYMHFEKINNDYYLGVSLLCGYRLKKEKYSFELSTGPTLYTPLLSIKKTKWENGVVEKRKWTPYKFSLIKYWGANGWMLYQSFWTFNAHLIKKVKITPSKKVAFG